jgi:hypothetical protein
MSKTDFYSVKENPKPYNNMFVPLEVIYSSITCVSMIYQDVVHIHIMSSKQHIMKYSTSNQVMHICTMHVYILPQSSQKVLLGKSIYAILTICLFFLCLLLKRLSKMLCSFFLCSFFYVMCCEAKGTPISLNR